MAHYYATMYFTGDGTTTRWNISFAGARPDTNSGTTAWFSTADVKAATIVQNADGTETETELAVTVIGPTQVDITPAVAKDVRFKIYRDSEREYPLVDFQDYSALTASELDEAFRQTLYGVQELSDLATYSDLRSIRAGVIAQSSVDDAKAAVVTADAATAAAAAATETANKASSTATDAASLVDGAVKTANEAKATADGIASTADDAKSIATSANNTAIAANATATGIAGTANDALRIANQAKTTADSATTTANEAKSTASSIDSKATQAQTDAKTAISTANEAKLTANTIDNKATDAQRNASTALTVSQNATTAANNATSAANTAQGTADNAIARLNTLKEGAYMTRSSASVWSLAGVATEAASTSQLVELRAYASAVAKDAVIERGYNDRGKWTKFSDGTMICWEARLTKEYSKGYIDWTYPQAFVDVPSIVVTPIWTDDSTPWKTCLPMAVAGTTNCTVYLYTDTNGNLANASTRRVSVTVTGRWK